jgi:hypothetical protein
VDMSVYDAMDAMSLALESKPEPLLENMDRKVSDKEAQMLEGEAPSKTKTRGPGSVTSNATKKSSGRKKKLSGRNGASSGRK